MTNRTTAELREAIEKLRSLVSDWRNADTRAGLCADPDDLDLEGLSEAAEEANYCYDMAATHFMLWSEDILDALLPQPPALGGIVEEIDAAFDKTELLTDLPCPPIKSRDEITPDAPNAVAEINAVITITNHWPTLRANLKQEEWQDISTAPKDGTRILINEGNEDYPEVVYWDPAYGDEGFYRNHATAWVNNSSEQMDEQPTHWKPIDLPTPPQSKKEG